MRLTAMTALLISGVLSIGLGLGLTAARGDGASQVQLVAFDVQPDENMRHLHLMLHNGDNLSKPDIEHPNPIDPVLSSFYDASFTPDGRYVVAQGFDPAGTAQLFEIDLHTDAATPLSSPRSVHITSPAVSPDGEWIAYTLLGGITHVWVMRRDGTDARQLTYDGQRNLSPVWTPDGSALIFTRQERDRINLYAVDIATLEITQLTDTDEIEGWPAVSPDGEWIAFTSRDLRVDRSFRLTIMRRDGSERQTLTSGDRLDESPEWSADGQKIYFSSYKDTTRQIYRIDRDGSDLEKLTDVDGAATAPTLSPVIDRPFDGGPPLALGVGLLAGFAVLVRWRR